MLKDVSLTLITRCLIVICGVVTSIVSARALGPHGRGEFFYIVMLAALCNQFGNLGLASSNTYLVAGDTSRLGGLLANSVWISLLAGIGTAVFALGILAFSGQLRHYSVGAMTLLVVLIPSLLFYLLASNLLVGVGLVRQFNAFQFCNTVLILLFMLAAALVRRDVLGFVIATTLANLLTAVALFLVLRRVAPRSSLSFDMNLFSSGFSYGAKAYGVTLLGLLVLRGNVFLLEKLNGLTQLGYFSIASQVADAIVILPTSVALVLFPSLVRNSDRAFGQTLRSALIVAGVTGCIVVLAGILIRPAVFIAFGSQFAPAITATRWILPGVFFLSVATILSQYLAARGFPLGVGIAWSLALCSMVTADVLLIPQHGATGAAMAFSISYFILFIALSFVASQQRAQAAAEVALAAVGDNV